MSHLGYVELLLTRVAFFCFYFKRFHDTQDIPSFIHVYLLLDLQILSYLVNNNDMSIPLFLNHDSDIPPYYFFWSHYCSLLTYSIMYLGYSRY